ncbi:purine-binding chemotaxis protein CheW [Nostoc sp. FACHB-87]|uniref:chemotaxis protein CheW n=1 Tax=Nostocaceae TaxID=1162 RepID=UPI00168646D2|nr:MULTISPECIES: chemotaxis protein CheW [Nostocaceae]MBD2297868.1 purine-binding chemotaxis protein CheW [Nostoc sp. FACHB-190]MBD2453984.1 purine-binding chemotaxis protein CheW [Nostoc sp. FACHB-87]MBD2476109.1 purine-binding chemotaxis protein CheW [Anabaena sp. FACHB-83]MBD2495709.1 purine-binding chemotaxis protein CheW [Nostoc sp. FACHB-280]
MVEQQLCTFWLNKTYFGIDVRHVQEVIRPQAITPVPLTPPDICGLINLRGQIITVIDLQQRLDMGEPARRNLQPEASPGFNIVVSSDHEIVSLLVDDVGDVLEFPENTFQPPPASLKGRMRDILAGAYPLAAGFLLVVDTEKILNVKII